MKISDCGAVEVDSNNRELQEHGSYEFPVAIYKDNLETMDVGWHWHEEMEIIFVLDGKGLFAVNEEKYYLSKGQGLFINSGALHGAWTTESNHCDICSVVYHPRLVAGGMNSLLWEKYIVPIMQNQGLASLQLNSDIEWQKIIMDQMMNAWLVAQKEEFGYEFVVRQSLSKIMLLLCKEVNASAKQMSEKRIRNGKRMKVMLDFIHHNYNIEIKMEDVARCAMISESECLRCFKEMLEMPPSKYIMEYRMQKACELLRHSSYSVKQIAEKCGFSDESYFGRLFRKQFHMTPLSYRKQKSEK